DWLQKTGYVRHDPDRRRKYENEKANSECADRSPDGFTLPLCRITVAVSLTHGFAPVGLVLLTRVFWPSIFAARSLFDGSSVFAFCHDSSAWETRFNFK